jgi:ABC-type transport system involved in cytochrome bd biosynthesis fused ATPase/permease subunit
MNILQNINDKTIIVITHDNDLLSIFDRIIVLNGGKIMEDINN